MLGSLFGNELKRPSVLTNRTEIKIDGENKSSKYCIEDTQLVASITFIPSEDSIRNCDIL
jgi:hypothetical protein